jgi:ABC-type spermidine/putrescine transport system permease subunit I
MVREGRRYAPAAKEGLGGGDRRARWREAALGLALASPPLVVLFLLIVLPAVDAFTFSLGLVPTDNPVFSTGMHLVTSPTPTLAVYRNLVASAFFRDDFAITLEVTALSVVFVLVVAYVLALYVRFGSGRLASVVSTLYLVPMFVPVVIASYAIITFYVDHGLLQAILSGLRIPYASPVYGPGGIVIGEVWTSIPFAVLMLGSGLDALPQELIEAAQDVGAGFFSILWRIVLPLNIVPTLIVVTFTFIGVLGSFTVPYLIGPNAPQMFGVAMDAYFIGYQQPQPAVAIAFITFFIAALAGVVYVWATARSGRAV